MRRAVCNYYKLTCSFAFEVYCTHAALQACTVRCGAMSAQTNTFARSGRRAMINWTNLSPKVWLKLCAFLFVARWQYRYTNRETMLLRHSPPPALSLRLSIRSGFLFAPAPNCTTNPNNNNKNESCHNAFELLFSACWGAVFFFVWLLLPSFCGPQKRLHLPSLCMFSHAIKAINLTKANNTRHGTLRGRRWQ